MYFFCFPTGTRNNVIVTSERYIDLETTFKRRYVSAGFKASKKDIFESLSLQDWPGSDRFIATDNKMLVEVSKVKQDIVDSRQLEPSINREKCSNYRVFLSSFEVFKSQLNKQELYSLTRLSSYGIVSISRIERILPNYCDVAFCKIKNKIFFY